MHDGKTVWDKTPTKFKWEYKPNIHLKLSELPNGFHQNESHLKLLPHYTLWHSPVSCPSGLCSPSCWPHWQCCPRCHIEACCPPPPQPPRDPGPSQRGERTSEAKITFSEMERKLDWLSVRNDFEIILSCSAEWEKCISWESLSTNQMKTNIKLKDQEETENRNASMTGKWNVFFLPGMILC